MVFTADLRGEKWIYNSHGWICMLISLSISVRHSPWFHEINIHLLLMALMRVLHHKNSRASPPTAGSWVQHMGDTCRHMDTKCGDECKHRMKCFLLIKMFLCLVETVKDMSAKYALCLQRKVFDVGSKWYEFFSFFLKAGERNQWNG